MKILVIGGGGREHAIIMKLSQSPSIELFCAPGNGGISKFAKCFNVKATDIDGVISLAKEISADIVFVAPDDPLVMGMVDKLNEAGFKTFGPKANAAILEGSKVFSKAFMKKYNIPTAAYETFSDSESAINYIKSQNQFPTVIKADGLALGKGVIIANDINEAIDAVNSIMEDRAFGASGNNIVIEEFLTGPEVTVLAFTDGITVKPMISSTDHKRALDGDKGLNTGGMGVIGPSPFYTEDIAKICMDEIFQPTIDAMRKENRPFQGCIYFGLMITPSGPKVIEYNCRFGDPEAQVVLSLLESDLVEIITAINDCKLAEYEVNFSNESCACVVIASGGYPEKYETGIEINGLDENGQVENVFVYHAGTKLENSEFYTSGGRVLGVTAKANDLKSALDKAYLAVDKIDFKNKHYRKDIGIKALI